MRRSCSLSWLRSLSKPTALPVPAGGALLRAAIDFDTTTSIPEPLSFVLIAPELSIWREYDAHMTDNTDKDGGRPREYNQDDVLTALRELDDGSSVRTGKIAEEVGCSRRTALRRLSSLESDGKVESSKVTERMKLWSVE